eukprot:tig00020912_g15802.t1
MQLELIEDHTVLTLFLLGFEDGKLFGSERQISSSSLEACLDFLLRRLYPAEFASQPDFKSSKHLAEADARHRGAFRNFAVDVCARFQKDFGLASTLLLLAQAALYHAPFPQHAEGLLSDDSAKMVQHMLSRNAAQCRMLDRLMNLQELSHALLLL